MRAHFYDPVVLGERRTLMVQLRAVLAGLYCLDADVPHETPVEVRLGHEDALAFLEDWARGGTAMPHGYRIRRASDATSLLERLRQRVVAKAGALTFTHRPAHCDNILHQAAESLAVLGLRTCSGLIPTPGLARVALEYARKTSPPTSGSHCAKPPGPRLAGDRPRNARPAGDVDHHHHH